MALVKRDHWYHNWWDEIDRIHRDMDDHFRRLNLRTDDSWLWPSRFRFRRPWRSWSLDRLMDDRIEHDGNKYKVIIDVRHFEPEEITVRTEGNCITVEGDHREKKDGYQSKEYLSKQFIRRYILPNGYDMSLVKSDLSAGGTLTITAPKLTLPPPPLGERIVPVRRSYYR